MHDEATRELVVNQQGKFFGKYRGLVVNNVDVLEGRGRLQVQVPQVLGDMRVWALPCVPYAGNGVGFFALPPNDTPIWVEFEAGDPSYPIWSGCMWTKGDVRSATMASKKFLKTDMFTIEIDENLGNVVMKTNTGDTQITMNAHEITLKAPMVTVEGAAGKKVSLTGISMSVNNGALEVM